MSSHNSAISSRTDLNPVVSSQSLYIATVVGRLCCTHLLIHYNASPPNPCIIVLGRPEVYLFLRASSFFAFASTDSPVAFQPHFRAHFNDAMFACWNLKSICRLPIALVYTSFLVRSIFLALNTFMNWTHKGKEITNMPEDVVGFVYMITNTTNGRMYIGKKLAKFKRSRPPLKGRRNKRRYKVNSDWQDYYGSSDDLTLDVNRLGKDKFSREILFYCKSKAELSYVEAREQFARKVLESNDYYNGHIRVRVHGKGILKK